MFNVNGFFANAADNIFATFLAGALAGTAMAQAPDTGCALPSEPEGIPAALDAAITGPVDKDRACLKALLIPEARMIFVSLGTGGAPTYRIETLDAARRCQENFYDAGNHAPVSGRARAGARGRRAA